MKNLFFLLLLATSLQAQELKNSYHKILPHYKGQDTEASCSAASSTIVFNAMLFPEFVFSENSLIASSGSSKWRTETLPTGHGLTLNQLNEYLSSTVKNLKLEKKIEVMPVHMSHPQAASLYQEALKSFKLGEGQIIMMFDQGIFTGDGSYGHFSPVGDYDEKNEQVLILDTDAQYFTPYWVSVDKALKGMDTMDDLVPMKRGFIWIRRK